jgi:hypothetical protein
MYFCKPSVDVGDVLPRLAVGQGDVLKRAVDLFLSVREPALDVRPPLAPCGRPGDTSEGGRSGEWDRDPVRTTRVDAQNQGGPESGRWASLDLLE